MNMSYCRFRNTRDDLEYCCGSLEECEELSWEEEVAAETLYELSWRYMEAYREWKAQKGGEE